MTFLKLIKHSFSKHFSQADNFLNPLSVSPQNLPTNCLSVFDHFVELVLQRLTLTISIKSISLWISNIFLNISTGLYYSYFLGKFWNVHNDIFLKHFWTIFLVSTKRVVKMVLLMLLKILLRNFYEWDHHHKLYCSFPSLTILFLETIWDHWSSHFLVNIWVTTSEAS